MKPKVFTSKEDDVFASFEPENLKQHLNFTTQGFIKKNDLKFPFETQLNSYEESDLPEIYSLSQENLDLSKGKYMIFRQKSLISLLQVSSNLQELDLSCNKLEFFPIELIHLSHLKSLKIDFNEIKSISLDIDRLSKLEFFSISNNQLSSLPANFNKLNLKVLNIGKNFINDLEPIALIKSLEILYIYANPFISIPTSFYNLNNLKELALEWFKYTEPSMNPIIKRPKHNDIFDKLFSFCKSKSDKKEKNLEIIKFLHLFSSQKLDFQQKDSKGRNLLHNTAFEEEIGVLHAIALQYPRLLNLVDKDGQTPLTLALLEEKFRIADMIIDLGGDLLLGGGIFGSSLHLAVSKLKSKLVEKLLKGLKGCDKKKKILEDFDQNSPFHILFSIFSKDEKEAELIAEMLLNFGVDPNLKNKEIYTALHIAIKKNQIKALKFAINYNKQNEIFEFNKRGGNARWSLAHLAAFLGNIEVLQLLEETKMDFFRENAHYQNPLKVSFQSIVVIKTIRKGQKKWIQKNIIQKKQYMSDFIERINDSEETINKNMIKKQQVFQNSSRNLTNLLKLDTPKGLFQQFIKSRRLDEEEILDNEVCGKDISLNEINNCCEKQNIRKISIETDKKLILKETTHKNKSTEYKNNQNCFERNHLAKTSKNVGIIPKGVKIPETELNYSQNPLYVKKGQIIKKALTQEYDDNIQRMFEKPKFVENKEIMTKTYKLLNNRENAIGNSLSLEKALNFQKTSLKQNEKTVNKTFKVNVITENDDLDEFQADENISQKMLNKSSQIITNITERDHSSDTKHSAFENKSEVSTNVFIFKRKDMISFQVFEEENKLEKEIERVQTIINNEDKNVLSENFLGFLYLNAIKKKINGTFYKYSSVRLPINMFLLSEGKVIPKISEKILSLIENFIKKTTIQKLELFKAKRQSLNDRKFKNFNEELKFIRKANECKYSNLNLILFGIFTENYDFHELPSETFERKNILPKVLLYEMFENTIQMMRMKKKSQKRKTHVQTKSLSNVSVIINNNFYFTNKKEENEEIKQKKQFASFWGISPVKLDQEKNGGLDSKPYFLV